jgi:hypothetical protein
MESVPLYTTMLLPELHELVVQWLPLAGAYRYACASHVTHEDTRRARCLPSQRIPTQWTHEMVDRQMDRRFRQLVAMVYYRWRLATGWLRPDPSTGEPIINLHYSAQYEYVLFLEDFSWGDHGVLYSDVGIEEWKHDADGSRRTGAGLRFGFGGVSAAHGAGPDRAPFEHWFAAAVASGRFDCQNCLLGMPQ